jgi:hypothetical protein
MVRPVPRGLRPTLFRRGFAWIDVSAAAVGILGLASCSLWLDASASQCASDGDCARFGAAVCDLIRHVCVPAAAPVGGAGGANSDAGAPSPLCRDSPQGCHPCAVGGAAVFLNACNDSTCVPFDNSTRLTNLTPDGNLKPLPPPP